jgi:hypothetical protein
VLVGYSTASKGYRIYSLERKSVAIARNVKFNENSLGGIKNLGYEDAILLEEEVGTKEYNSDGDTATEVDCNSESKTCNWRNNLEARSMPVFTMMERIREQMMVSRTRRVKEIEKLRREERKFQNLRLEN